ncbi:unnamed protein product [Phytomonas sp. Hart1]|nr:unnamed protein product [Phytomonas sp. Hart1]|eukprot:CCW68871.1 unnamed protein product [Phytomonas sp. isolate Hart1]
MMRHFFALRRQYRPYYNLPSKSENGRKMTGFLTPYRHWMWKQNELWRNVHEAQFEHLRKVHKRQWLESFRVNANEYIYKYNITKAAQLAQWEFEMQTQENKRIENQQLSHGRQALKKKHLDLLREFYERQFFYWYERASERLQYMEHINYVPQANFIEHLECELDKYVAGSKFSYPLNFAGQLPLLEDRAGNITQIPATLMPYHATENQDSGATMYQPPQSTKVNEVRLLELMASAHEEDMQLQADESQAFSTAMGDIDREEEEKEFDRKVAPSMEESYEERETNRRAYIDRGKIGSKLIIRRPRLDDDTGKLPTPSSTPMKRQSKNDKVHSMQAKQDAISTQLQKRFLKPGIDLSNMPKRGEIGEHRGRIRDKIQAPTLDELSKNPILQKTNTLGRIVRTQDSLDKRYGRGKYKTSKPNSGEDL